MLSFLKPILRKSNGVELSVALDHPSGSYRAGDPVQAILSIRSQETLQVQEARIVLLRRERYECRDGDDTDDDVSHTSGSVLRFCRTDELDFAGNVIMRDGVIPARVPQTYHFTASLPTDAQPTWRGGKIVDLVWLVQATLEPQQGAAVKSEAEVLVTHLPEQRSESGGEFGQSAAGDAVGLAFSLKGNEWLTGEVIEGHLVVRPRQDVEMNEIRVELERIEFVSYGTGNTFADKRSLQLARKAVLPAGKTLALPFSLPVPYATPVSGKTANASVTWLLRGVLEQGSLRPDIRLEEEMVVYSGK